jgi:hypothetical protein
MVRVVDKKNPRDSTQDEAPAKQKRVRVSRELPTIGELGSVKELEFKTREKSSKYGEIVAAIHKLKPNQYISFTVHDGEDVMSLKSRVSSLVSRVCEPPEGLRYRTRATVDNHVVVYAERIPEEDAGKVKAG